MSAKFLTHPTSPLPPPKKNKVFHSSNIKKKKKKIEFFHVEKKIYYFPLICLLTNYISFLYLSFKVCEIYVFPFQ